jgi:hypothetical protein
VSTAPLDPISRWHAHILTIVLSLLFFAVLSCRRCISKKSKDPTYSSEHQTKRPSSIRTHQSKTSLKKNYPSNYHRSNNIPPQPQYPTSLVYVIVLCNFYWSAIWRRNLIAITQIGLGFNLFVLYTERKSEQMGDRRWPQRVSTYIIFQIQYGRGRGYAMKARSRFVVLHSMWVWQVVSGCNAVRALIMLKFIQDLWEWNTVSVVQKQKGKRGN